MSDAAGKTFSCERCGQTFAWNDSLAGKQVQCKCGHAFVVAGSAKPQAAELVNDVYDVGEEPTIPPPVELAPPQPLPKVLAYRRVEPVSSEQKEAEPSVMKNLWLPVALLAIGFGLRGAQLAVPGATSHGMAVTLGLILLGTALNVALTLGGLFVAASFLGVNFGPLAHAAVKAAAASILVGGIGGFVATLDRGKGMQGPIIALHLNVILYWILFGIFFELDVQETLVTVVIVTAFQMAAFCILFSALR
jgi:hypothetical protein